MTQLKESINKVQKFKNMARFIKRYRVLAQLSQVEFAKHLGIGEVQYISNIERGMCGLPPKQINNVANALGVVPSLIIDIMLADHEDFLRSIVASTVNDKTKTSAVGKLDISDAQVIA